LRDIYVVKLNQATSQAKLLQQRSVGHVKLHVGKLGIIGLRESGASKLRLPKGSRDAFLINTGGGVAGGDVFQFEISSAADSVLTVTSQAAERVYCTLGPPAVMTTTLAAAENSELFWLPQESILFDGASLQRSYSVTLADHAKFLAVEPIVFGRTEMGEKVQAINLHDRWRISRSGKLVHAEELQIENHLPASKATLDGATAMATLIYIADDAERHIDRVRVVIGDHGGASAWNGKLLARVLAKDGFHLRKVLISVLDAVTGDAALPKTWTL
jgi:urease accessory protein